MAVRLDRPRHAGSGCWYRRARVGGHQRSSLVRAVLVMVDGRILIGSERVEIDRRSTSGHGREFLARDELSSAPQRYQLANAVAVPCHCESLPVLDGVHDLLGPITQITLGDLRLRRHDPSLDGRSTLCY